AQALAPQSLDLADPFDRQAMRAARRDRLAVVERCRAAAAITGQPLVGRALRHACRPGGIAHPPAFNLDTLDQKDSTMHRHARILTNAHPGLRPRVGWLRNPYLAASPGPS